MIVHMAEWSSMFWSPTVQEVGPTMQKPQVQCTFYASHKACDSNGADDAGPLSEKAANG